MRLANPAHTAGAARFLQHRAREISPDTRHETTYPAAEICPNSVA